MSDIAIRVENLGKKYHLRRAQGLAGYRTMREALLEAPQRMWSALTSAARSEDEFWALRDVSFEVKRGEVLGVIGRNGAGKSTLLKILSRIVEPTQGQVDLYGRVGSLLEVGTGFHPELTARENIFLSGAMLGMRRPEVRARFDEIVQFAEVEQFLDTPCKHYSSGMYARLGFAVAAHLNPEILIVDEILAVGDAAFQERCVGRMRHVAKSEGRTVLVVSHSMVMVQNLCTRALFLDEGRVGRDGTVTEGVRAYVNLGRGRDGGVIAFAEEAIAPAGHSLVGRASLREVEMHDSTGALGNRFAFGEPFEFRVRVSATVRLPDFILGFSLNTQEGQVVVCSNHYDALPRAALEVGEHVFRVKIAGLYLAPGTYSLTWAITAGNQRESYDFRPDCGVLHIEARTLEAGTFVSHLDLRPGWLRPPLPWQQLTPVT